MKHLAIGFTFLLALSANVSASVIYEFTINTGSLSGQAANLDFQLNPGGSNPPAVSASITGFVTDGTYNPADIALMGDATGGLPSSLILDNGTSYNDAYQSLTLGNTIDFFLTLSGAGVDNPGSDGTVFAFSIYDSTGTVPQLTNALDGSIAGITLDSVNGIQPYTNPPSGNQTSVATITPVNAPEPSSYLLISCGLTGLALKLRRRT